MKVKLQDILDAMEMVNPYDEYFLDKETGEFEYVSEMMMTRAEREEVFERLDEHGFYRIPNSFEIRDYDIMEDFIGGMPEGVRGRMYQAIQGHGAFGRFRDMIQEMGIESVWYDFRDSAYKRAAIRWCDENGINYTE